MSPKIPDSKQPAAIAEPAKTGNEPSISKSKRRLMAGAPLLLTIANKPAMATYCGVSGRLSGNMSVASNVTCYGDPPSYWANNMPSAYTDTPVNEVYPGLCDDDTTTFTQACEEDGADQNVLPNLLAAHCNLETYGQDSYGISVDTFNQWLADVQSGDVSCLADLMVLNGVTPT